MMRLEQVAKWLSVDLVGDPGVLVQRVHTDTRSLAHGDLFVALKGEHFDAHDYLAEAKAKVAVAALAQRGLKAAGLAGVEVADTKSALGQLAASWRSQFALSLIAVTGSNGKTTVTQMIASILRAQAGEQSLATQGNLNNDIGVPLTLLRLRHAHRLAVIELGMNHPGEIAYLADLAQPTIALVNNAQREHQEFMKSVEAVARENAAVIEALPADGVAVFPWGDDYTPLWRSMAGTRRSMTFGMQALADVSAQARWGRDAWSVEMTTPGGTAHFQLRIAGRHNVQNAMAATACALAAGIALDTICLGLEQFEPVKGRSRVQPLVLEGKSLTLVDDSYNANPDSVRAAIDVLAELPGPQLLVLGDMGEVGDQGPEFHREVGAYARERGVSAVFLIGGLAIHAAPGCPQARHFTEMGVLLSAVRQEAARFGSILVKGSRFMKMERVIEVLMGMQLEQSKELGGASCS